MVVEFSRPRDYEIGGWLFRNVPRFTGRRIAKNDADYLADRVGYNLDLLNSELQKIDLSLPPGKAIDRRLSTTLLAAIARWHPLNWLQALLSRTQERPCYNRQSFFGQCLHADGLGRPCQAFLGAFQDKEISGCEPRNRQDLCRLEGIENIRQTASAMAIGKAAGLLHEGQEKTTR